MTPLTLELTVPVRVLPGARVRMTLALTNEGADPMEIYLRGRDVAFDIIIARPDDTIIWRRLQGEIIPGIVQIKVLAPRETLELHAQWDQRSNTGTHVPPGDYTVRGVLLTDAATIESAPVSFRIEGA